MRMIVTCDFIEDFEVVLESPEANTREFIFIDCQADNEVRLALTDEQLQQVSNVLANAGFEPDN